MMIWAGDDLHVVIDHPNRCAVDDKLFKWQFESDRINLLPQGSKIWDVLVQSGLFPSKKEAHKNWKYGELVEGINRFEALGKYRKNVYVLKLPDDFPVYHDDDNT